MSIVVHVRRGRGGEYQAYCPDVPGCAAVGQDEDEALRKLEARYVECVGEPAPEGAFSVRHTRPSMRLISVLLAIGGCAITPPQQSSADLALSTTTVVVNECSVGTGGYIELYNASTAAVDLAQDAASCWYVDDEAGGGSPKRITDAIVNHPAGSTTCAAAGRSATCGIVGPHERVWVSYSYVNSTTADQCRLLQAALLGGTCDSVQNDVAAGGPTSGGGTGHCYGRLPDGGDWQTGQVTCTPSGASNGCVVGASCDDGNACTTNDVYDASCTCAGTAVACDDTNPCTADVCDPASGCSHADLADGTSCGSDATCESGTCVAAPPPPPPSGPTITDGIEDHVLLRGTIVGPGGPYAGEVLVVGNTIVCAAASCSDLPAALGATVIDNAGLVLPGMVDAHNHGLFNIFDQHDWTPSKVYTNHNQWTAEPRYKQLVDAKQYLDGETSTLDYKCEMDKWGELRAMVSGTTSMLVAPGTSKACFGSLTRSIDVSQNDLGVDKMQTSISVPSNTTAQSVCNNFASGATTAYVVHVAEGVDATARNEFATLASRAGGCLLSPHTTIVHGTALGAAEFQTMAAHGMGLVWSPRSNDFLYQGTTHIELAVAAGVHPIALAPDWGIGGSANLLDEVRYAKAVDVARLGGVLGDQRLFDMVTIDAARAVGLDAYIGSIEVGKRADLFVIPGDPAAPYAAVQAAHPGDVSLVMIDGRVLYGDTTLAAAGPAAPGCEALTVEGHSKFICVAEASTSNLLDQTFTTIQQRLIDALASYDATFLTPTTGFSPLTELVPAGY